MVDSVPHSSYPESASTGSHAPSGTAWRVSDSASGPVGVEGPPAAVDLDTHSLGGPSAVRGTTLGGGPEGVAPLGLLEKEEWSQRKEWSLRSYCPLDHLSAFDPQTGEFVPGFDPRCKNPRCYRCARAYVGRTFALARLALDHVDRSRLVTFTLASQTDADSWTWADWQEARKVQRRNLRRKGLAYESLSVVEEGSDNGRPHMHDVQHGSFIPKDVLSASWPHGMTNIKSAASAGASYLSKSALPYLAKNASAEGSDDALVDHMNLNGGRAEHHTRGFYAGMSREAFARTLDPMPGAYLLRYLDSRHGGDLSRGDVSELRRVGAPTPRTISVRRGP